MPQVDCYLCEADVIDVAATLFKQGGTITPAMHYLTPEPLVICERQQLRDFLNDSDVALLLALSPQWQRSPLQLDSIIKEGREAFYVRQKEGGPTLDIFYPRPYEIGGSLALPPGFMAYHDRFWNPLTRAMEPAPPSLAETYRGVKACLTRGGRSIVRKNRKLTITQNSLKSGLKLLDLKTHVSEKPRFVPINGQ